MSVQTSSVLPRIFETNCPIWSLGVPCGASCADCVPVSAPWMVLSTALGSYPMSAAMIAMTMPPMPRPPPTPMPMPRRSSMLLLERWSPSSMNASTRRNLQKDPGRGVKLHSPIPTTDSSLRRILRQRCREPRGDRRHREHGAHGDLRGYGAAVAHHAHREDVGIGRGGKRGAKQQHARLRLADAERAREPPGDRRHRGELH